jgi:hypothetical protein
MTDAHNRYHDDESTYNRISMHLNGINRAFFELPEAKQNSLLFWSDLYALMSVMTNVNRLEPAFPKAINAESKAEYRDIYYEHTILFPNNKSEYSAYNLTEVDYDVQRKMLEQGRIDDVHRYKVENVHGVSYTKAAFSLAMLGFTEKMCIDSHVQNYFDMDGRLNVNSVAEYERICGSLRSKDPFLAEETCPFMFQWAVFDADRNDELTPHTRWFEMVDQFIDLTAE